LPLELGKVLAQLGGEHGRERDRALPGLGLRGSERRPAVRLLDELPVYPDRAGFQVDIGRTERGQLGPSQAGESGEQDEHPVSLVDRVGNRVDLGNRQDRTLGGLLLSGTLDPAGVTPDHPVISRSVEYGPEQPVCLGRGDFAYPGVE